MGLHELIVNATWRHANTRAAGFAPDYAGRGGWRPYGPSARLLEQASDGFGKGEPEPSAIQER